MNLLELLVAERDRLQILADKLECKFFRAEAERDQARDEARIYLHMRESAEAERDRLRDRMNSCERCWRDIDDSAKEPT